MTAPSSPGSYVVSAVGFESDGTLTTGLPARVSFVVSPAPAAAPQGGASPGQQQAAARPGTGPSGATGPNTGQFAEPKVPSARPFRSPPALAKTPLMTGGRGGADDRAAVVNTEGGVIRRSGGGPVFAGSLARADRTAAVASRRELGTARKVAGGTHGAVPSERSALSDAWSGLASDGAASLLPKTTDAAPGGGATGLQLVWGLALIGIALLALVGGLVSAGARRRTSRGG